MSDFAGSGPPLVGGSIRGMRAWVVDNDTHEIFSPSRADFLWNRGENLAVCTVKPDEVAPSFAPREDVERILREHYLPDNCVITRLRSVQYESKFFLDIKLSVLHENIVGAPSMNFKGGISPKFVEFTETGYEAEIQLFWHAISKHMDPIVLEHDMDRCGCGFYAYFNPTHRNAGISYLRGDAGQGRYGISGVIEGYGMVTMGPHGFRAMKAKILAVCVSDAKKFIPMSEMYPDIFFFKKQEEMLAEFPLGVQDLAA